MNNKSNYPETPGQGSFVDGISRVYATVTSDTQGQNQEIFLLSPSFAPFFPFLVRGPRICIFQMVLK